MKKQYTYAVARIRSKEISLLKKQDVNQLLSFESLDEQISFLKDKGWGNDNDKTFKEILESERNKMWDFISEITDNEEAFELFLCPTDYTNLKTAIKATVMNDSKDGLFLSHGSVDYNVIYDAIKNKKLDLLPRHMQSVAKEAFEILLHTNDSQLSDVIIDKAALERISEIGKKSRYNGIKEYAELFVVSTNIKIAMRGIKTSKSIEFFNRSMAKCESIDVVELAKAATKSVDDVYDYLLSTKYSGAVDALKTSMSTFEKWCDNLVLKTLKESSQYDSFTLLPIFFYVLARENEMKVVRLVMVGKTGGLSEEVIRERLRDVYA